MFKLRLGSVRLGSSEPKVIISMNDNSQMKRQNSFHYLKFENQNKASETKTTDLKGATANYKL